MKKHMLRSTTHFTRRTLFTFFLTLLFCAALLMTGCDRKKTTATSIGWQEQRICNNERLSDEDVIKQIAAFLLFVDKEEVITAKTLTFSDCVYILRTMLVHTDAIIDERVQFNDPVISVDADTANEYIRLLFGCDMPPLDEYYVLPKGMSTDQEYGVRDGMFYFGTGWWNAGKYQYSDGKTDSIDYNEDGTISADIVYHPRYWMDAHVIMTLIPVDTAFRFQIVSFQNVIVDNTVEKPESETTLVQPEDTPDPSACATPVDGRLTAAILAYDQADYEESFPLFWELADEGNAYAQYFVGESYKYGYGVEGSSEKCVYWYMTAAANGDGYGQASLGTCYRDGYGVGADYEKMLYWYTLSAQQANPSGLINLGYCYHKGIGVEVNLEEARDLYELADLAGHPYAKTRLAEVNLLLCG